jgi:hypothetical protein
VGAGRKSLKNGWFSEVSHLFFLGVEIMGKQSILKMGEGIARLVEDSGDMGLRDLVVVRYMGVLVTRLRGDEEKSLELCSQVMGMEVKAIREVWLRRDGVIGCNDAQFQISGDYLKDKVRATYMKLVDELFNRDFKGETIRTILDALKVMAQLEVGMGMSGGLEDNDTNGLGNKVQVTRSNVIIVPMPESARSQTREVDGHVVSEAGVDTPRDRHIKNLYESIDKTDKMLSDVEVDALEEVKVMEQKVLARIGGDK